MSGGWCWVLSFHVSTVSISEQSVSWNYGKLWRDGHFSVCVHPKLPITHSWYVLYSTASCRIVAQGLKMSLRTAELCNHIKLCVIPTLANWCFFTEIYLLMTHFCLFTCDVSLLFLEDDLYAAAPLDADGSSLQFRRKAGSRTNVWMYDSWVSGG